MIKEAQRCIVCNTRCPSSTHIQLDSGGSLLFILFILFIYLFIGLIIWI